MADRAGPGSAKGTSSHGSKEDIAYVEKNDGGVVGATKEQLIQGHAGREHDYTLLERQRDPYLGKSEASVIAEVEALCEKYDLGDLREELIRGAQYAFNDKDIDRFNPTHEERQFIAVDKSKTWRDKWRHPFMMYYVGVLCGSAAIVQGMDQTAVNGAQLFYLEDFGITNSWEVGLVNGAPYLCCVCIACWLAPFWNKFFGRRGTIFICCFLSLATGIWQAVTFSKWQLFAARFCAGFAVGAKSSTTPTYAAECAPPRIRGALGTQWQMWTAFGIMLGFVASVAFYSLDSLPGLNWRLMLASTGIPPIFVCIMTYFAPESPRWYMDKGKYRNAYKSLITLRHTRLQAARDLYDIHIRLMLEYEVKPKSAWKRATALFSVPRNRRAAQSSFFVMYMQQFCGVNVIAYYSSQIFIDAGSTEQTALLFSLGTGIINWLFAIPGMVTIDSKGRRWLLLTTFPYMALCLFFTGFSFLIPNEQALLGCVATGIYLFMVGYSPGMGPVPFTYSAEVYPLSVRDVGMSFATATCWGFNFILALTWPALVAAFSSTGAFCWYAGWNLFGLVFTWFCMPETKERPLEELDAVFNIRTRDHARYYFERFPGIKLGALSKNRQNEKMDDVAAVVERRASVVSMPQGDTVV